jgi:hypothetical protein
MAVGPLIVKVITAPSVPGQKALALCTEDGEMVGKQFSCTVENEATSVGVITVRFYIDGDAIRFASNDD